MQNAEQLVARAGSGTASAWGAAQGPRWDKALFAVKGEQREGNRFPINPHFFIVCQDVHGYNFLFGGKVMQRKNRAQQNISASGS